MGKRKGRMDRPIAPRSMQPSHSIFPGRWEKKGKKKREKEKKNGGVISGNGGCEGGGGRKNKEWSVKDELLPCISYRKEKEGRERTAVTVQFALSRGRKEEIEQSVGSLKIP